MVLYVGREVRTLKKLGEQIKRARLQKEWTQEELAKRMGYKSKSTINKIELGVNDIPQSKVLQFAEVLEVSPRFLMGWENENPEDLGALAAEVLSNAKMLQLMKNVRKLSGADFETVCTLVDSLANKKGQR